MNEEPNSEPVLNDLPTAAVQTKKRQFSIVWIVPLVAVIIGGWLVYKALTEKGPTITISFKSAEGLEAGKTKIKYKDVEIGRVEAITLSADLSQIIVSAEMVKGVEKYLSENSRFWVVRARVAAGDRSLERPDRLGNHEFRPHRSDGLNQFVGSMSNHIANGQS